ncbi:TBC1 domain family member 22B [Acipenser ruthenus]|uniref:TBC1 domain family member 22B n=1 Tax=Acipenser ruthenus TaxID=7906 RepID=A0A444V7J1_ACIRT|nr:TBC1 domain family member 22B [Acipenser ruthenus]
MGARFVIVGVRFYEKDSQLQIRWRKEILEEKDFQGLMILLQNLPTMHWGNEEISVLLAEAYRLKYAFADAPNHYKR